MEPAFYKFLELSGITITDTTNLTPLLADYWNFTAYAAEFPSNIFELNFIKWQLNGKINTANDASTKQVNTTTQYQTPPQSQVNTVTSQPQTPSQQINSYPYQPSPQHQTPPQPQVNTATSQPQTSPQQIHPYPYQTSPPQILTPSPSKILTVDFPQLPVKLAKLKKHVNIVEGQFSAFTLETPQPDEQNETIIIEEEKSSQPEPDEAIFPALTTYLEGMISNNVEKQNIPQVEPQHIQQVYTAPVKVNRGKDIAAARKSFEEEKKEKKTPARKRKRECGRPTNDQQLIRMDEEFNDMMALQLTRKQLTLPDTRGKCKKSRRILTKLSEDIVVNTNREYQTYELFADVRTEALKIIQEKRELLEKINAAEYVLYTLSKKQNSSDSSS
ncbi:Hypothetical predicted protein [Paramuricea clavata]|uniref:Uncharacterized protein n=1 Tax=Paramuricea clavata TaxID=317549 RepID=A0A6S7FRI5_PARCT|nr:Hypothetical predicted protein [Paramuricea clavata]